MIGDGKSTYEDITLYGLKKTTLISIIRCLEQNLIGADETIDIQTKQCEKLIKSTEVAYYKKGRADAIDEFAHALKETFNNEFPSNYHCTQPYFTLDNVRVLVDLVAKGQKNGI